MARTTAKAQLSRMQIVEEEKRQPGGFSSSVPSSRSAASTLIRTLPEPQARTQGLVLSSPPEDNQTTSTLSGLAHPTPFHLTQLEKKQQQQQHHHIRSLLIDSSAPGTQVGNVNIVSIRGDGLQATTSTNSPNGMGSSDQIEDLELACLTSEFIEDSDINRIEPTISYAGPTASSALDQPELFNNLQARGVSSVLESSFPVGNSGSALGSSMTTVAPNRRSGPSSLPARFNFGSGPVVVPVRQVQGASLLSHGNGLPTTVGSAESSSGAMPPGGQGSSRAASRSSLMVAEEDVSNSAEMKQRQKKDQHNKVERKRREQINHFIALLGEMLPKKMFEGNSDNKKNKGTVLRKTTELIEQLSDENRELRSLLHRACEVLHTVYRIISAGVENNTISMTQEELQAYVELLQTLILKDRSDVLTEGSGQALGELSPSSAASCPPADTPVSVHPPTPSGLTTVPENGGSGGSGAHPPAVRAGAEALLLSNARSAPSSLSATYLSRGVKEEEAEMFASHDLTHVEPGELHTLLAQIAAPHSKHEPQDGAFAQLDQGLNAPSPHCFSNLPMAFMEDMDTNDGVSGHNIMGNLESSEGMDM